MDHMIRDAAENHHPAYNDQAWDKMEKMLDKHLPQKRDKRRYILFLLLFLLLGGGALLSVYKLGGNDDKAPVAITREANAPKDANKNNETSATSTKPVEAEQLNATNSESAGHTNVEKQDVAKHGDVNPTGNIVPAERPTTSAPAGHTKKNRIAATQENDNRLSGKRNNRSGNGRSGMTFTAGSIGNEETVAANENKNRSRKSHNKRAGSDKKNVSITPATPVSDDVKEKEEDQAVTKNEEGKPKEAIAQSSVVNEPAKNGSEKQEAVKKEEEKKKQLMVADNKTVAKSEKKQSTKKGFGGNFGISFSVGPDVSFVSLNKLGKATIMYGAGLSYTFAKQRLTVRTGFYTSKKIYDATPDQYHSPGGNYPYLYNVAAECKVYEIPLALSYNFGQHKKHSWFGSAGLSSFLMKSEYYQYQYKTPSGQNYNYPWSVKNENKHYFSVLTLSGGYNYKLSKRISLQAEPYVKIPLGGVGHGKVKLNSGGLLFTVTIKPFAKKE